MMLGLRQVVLSGRTIFILILAANTQLLLISSMWANDTFAYLLVPLQEKPNFPKSPPRKHGKERLVDSSLCLVIMGTLGSLVVTSSMDGKR
jgi:hypothetical protein